MCLFAFCSKFQKKLWLCYCLSAILFQRKKELELLGFRAIAVVLDEWNAMNMQVEHNKMKEKFFYEKIFGPSPQDQDASTLGALSE